MVVGVHSALAFVLSGPDLARGCSGTPRRAMGWTCPLMRRRWLLSAAGRRLGTLGRT